MNVDKHPRRPGVLALEPKRPILPMAWEEQTEVTGQLCGTGSKEIASPSTCKCEARYITFSSRRTSLPGNLGLHLSDFSSSPRGLVATATRPCRQSRQMSGTSRGVTLSVPSYATAGSCKWQGCMDLISPFLHAPITRCDSTVHSSTPPQVVRMSPCPFG